MAKPAFTPEIEKALDAYTVPPVPKGFSDRLMTRIASGDTGVEGASAGLPPLRTRRVNPWRRTGRVIGIVGTFSLATATAAAAGFFGDPVYVPGVSEALIEAKVVNMSAPVVEPKAKIFAATEPVVPAAAEQPPATGSAAIVNRVTDLRNDPEFAKLPPRERLRVAGKEVRQMVRSGEATRQDVRTAFRELAHDADPATKDAWRQAATERRERRLQRQDRLAGPVELQDLTEQQVATSEPTTTAISTLPAKAIANLAPEKAEALRERYRNATPEQRAAIRRTLRERRQAWQQRSAQ